MTPNPKSRIPTFIFYTGKGGVGKTTCAAAHAFRAAAAGRRTLLVSTDPAHSLGDVLEMRLSARPRRVSHTLRLDAAELDAPRAFARWIASHRDALGDVIEHGTWLDRADVDALLALPIPGVDELVGLVEIARLASREYHSVIVDTAPTGHTLRLLAAPSVVAGVARALDELQEEHRIIRQRLARGRQNDPEAADRLIELIARQAADLSAVLRDPHRTVFCWTTLPESLSLAESEDGIRALTESGFPVGAVIVNRLLPDGSAPVAPLAPSSPFARFAPLTHDVPCALCDRRRTAERQVVAAIRRTIGRGRAVCAVPAEPREPRGLRALAALSQHLNLFNLKSSSRPTRPGGRGRRTRHFAPGRSSPRGQPMPPTPPALPTRRARLIFVAGKGGVGKTTVAATMALRLAHARPNQSILLLSTDPAHSIADVLGSPAGDTPSGVHGAPSNLAARELDAATAMDDQRAALQAGLDEVSARLVDLAPPGIDELFGLLSVVEALATYHVIVVDTAPTGHLLRLLEMPDAAREWLRVLLRVLLRYRTFAGPGRLAAELVAASRTIRDLQSLLRDPSRTQFTVVTRAAAAPVAETRRLLKRLKSLRLSTPLIVVNARTLSPGVCPRCRATSTAERAALANLKRPRDCVIIQAPLVMPPPRGAAALARWALEWIAGERQTG